MNTNQVIRLERTARGYRLTRNNRLVGNYAKRSYAFRMAKQVFDATKKLTTGNVSFNNQS